MTRLKGFKLHITKALRRLREPVLRHVKKLREIGRGIAGLGAKRKEGEK